jgi:hypothetical protein
MASMQVRRDVIDPSVWRKTMQDVVHDYAKALAAAGEFTRFFAPKIHPGDEDDRIVFEEQCKVWQNTGHVFDAEAYWRSAQLEVRLRLQDSTFRAKAIHECRLVSSKLFSWINEVR